MDIPGATPRADPIQEPVELESASHVEERHVAGTRILGAPNKHRLTLGEGGGHAVPLYRDGDDGAEAKENPDPLRLRAGECHWDWAFG